MAKSSLGWKSNLASAIYCSILRPANGILSPSFKNHNEPLVTKLMPEKRQQCQSCSSSSLKMIIITFFSRCQTTGRLHPPWSGGPRVSGAAVWVSWPLTHRRRSLHNTPLLYCATVVENQRKSRIWKVFEREAKLNTKISSAFCLQNIWRRVWVKIKTKGAKIETFRVIFKRSAFIGQKKDFFFFLRMEFIHEEERRGHRDLRW